MIKEELLKILCCPETKQNLTMAGAGLIKTLNEKIVRKELKNRGDNVVTEPIDGGLVRADGRFLYIIRNDIPVMLIDEAISLEKMEPR